MAGVNKNSANSCEPKDKWASLLNQNKPIQNVCITKDYDYSYPPRKVAKVFNIFKSIHLINTLKSKHNKGICT